jgi:hypothetical protein
LRHDEREMRRDDADEQQGRPALPLGGLQSGAGLQPIDRAIGYAAVETGADRSTRAHLTALPRIQPP